MNIFESKNPEETKKLATKLVGNHKLILLSGDLGSGKTTFTKGLGEMLGIPESKIKSPSYTLIREYDDFMHVDFYRLTEPDDLIIGRIKSWLDEGRMALIEWPELMIEHLPTPHIHITINQIGDSDREIHVIENL